MKNSIIMNEVSFVVDEIMTDNVNIGLCKPYVAVSYILLWVRYLVQKTSLTKTEVWKRLNEHLSTRIEKYNKFKWRELIEKAYDKGMEYPLHEIDTITITNHELNCILKLKGIMIQKVMFSLLVLGKFYTELKEENNYWCNADYESIKKISNFSGTLDRFYLVLSNLFQKGLIKNNSMGTNIAINYDTFSSLSEDDDNQTAFSVTNISNLGLQYMYHSKRYHKNVGICKCCNEYFYRKTHNTLYCNKCRKY